jgi:hypothetical protein
VASFFCLPLLAASRELFSHSYFPKSLTCCKQNFLFFVSEFRLKISFFQFRFYSHGDLGLGRKKLFSRSLSKKRIELCRVLAGEWDICNDIRTQKSFYQSSVGFGSFMRSYELSTLMLKPPHGKILEGFA